MEFNRYLRTGKPVVDVNAPVRTASGAFNKRSFIPTFFTPGFTSANGETAPNQFSDVHVVVNKKGGKVKKYQDGKTLPHITDYDAAAKEHGFNSRDEVRAWQAQQQGLKVDGLFGDESRARYLALKEEENRAKEESKTPTYEQWLKEQGPENIDGLSDQEL